MATWIYNVPFVSSTQLPSELKPSLFSVLVPSIGNYLTSGDTVSVMPHNECRGFFGRIISVSSKIEDTFESPHPSIQNIASGLEDEECAFFQIQLFMRGDCQRIISRGSPFPRGNESIQQLNLPEAVGTNYTIWIPSYLVSDCIIFATLVIYCG